MPTRLPRVNVTVTEEQHALLLELASLEGVSASGFLRAMLDQATPLLRTSVPLLRAAAEEREITRERALSMLEGPLRELKALGLVDQLDMLDDLPSGANRTERSTGGRTGRPSRKSSNG